MLPAKNILGKVCIKRLLQDEFGVFSADVEAGVEVAAVRAPGERISCNAKRLRAEIGGTFFMTTRSSSFKTVRENSSEKYTEV